MKRKIFTFLVALFMLFTITSCEVYTHATTQDDIHVEAEADVVRSNISFDVILRYGTPYYRDGALLYYVYRDIYYYPFFYDNYWYVRAYRRPFIHFDHRPYFRPHKYDYRFSPGHYRGFDRPTHRPHIRPTNPNIGRPNGRPTNPNMGRPNGRPNNPNFGRPNGRPTNPNMGRPNGRPGPRPNMRPNNNRGRFGK